MASDLTDRERALAAREREVSQREALAAREKEFSPRVRLVITIVAQALGFLLLFILGFGLLKDFSNADVLRGYNFIRSIAWSYLAATISISALMLLLAYQQRKFTHFYADLILLSYVGVDLVLLLLLVCQEGGLCRSMFLPVFFLIPTAYLIAERREIRYRPRRVIVLLFIVSCICKSYTVARQHLPYSISPDMTPVARGLVTFWKWSVEITDFSALAHPYYDRAIFYASLISAFIPIIQIGLTMLRDRFSDEAVF